MREITFGTDGIVRLSRTKDETTAVTTDGWRPSWVASLAKPTGINPLDLRYFRTFDRPHSSTMGRRRFWLRDGMVYEAESAGPGGEPRLYAFQVQNGDVAWVHCVTLDRRGSMARIAQALE